MNDRIKELLTPKLKEWGGDLLGGNFSEELEKFAELIVLECAVIVGSMEEPHQDIAKLIKQHFGVEE